MRSGWIPLLALAALTGAAESLAPAAVVVGRLQDPDLGECSGVVASRTHADVLWAHNDSGNPAELFAIDADGVTIARYRIAAANTDWEDIALDAGGIYLADVGNNRRDRREVRILRVDEPDPARPAGDPLPVRASWRLTWPDRLLDCEALLIAGPVGYLIDKRLDGPPGLWRFRLDRREPQALERVATLPISAPITGADLSADGRRLAVCHPLGLHVFALPPGDLAAGVATAPCDYLGWLDPRQEACCFVPGGVLAISESRAIRWCSDRRLTGAGPPPIVIGLRQIPAGHLLDGEVAEWGVANAIGSEAVGSGVRAWAGWCAEGLVVAGEVAGSAPGGTPRAGRLGEILLGSGGSDRSPEYGPDDRRCILAVDAAGRLGLTWPSRPAPLPAARCAGGRNADGYRFEAFLPGATPFAVGDAVRFAVSLRAPGVGRAVQLPPGSDASIRISPANWAMADLVP